MWHFCNICYNFFSSYNYNDTKHDIKLGDDYRVFHSEYDKYIQVRVLFYSKETGNLVDSVLVYSENTNTQKVSVSLPAGVLSKSVKKR